MTTTQLEKSPAGNRKSESHGMSLKVYKPGQGYWTRLLSAIAVIVLGLAGAAWLWEKLSRIQGEWVVYLQGGVAVAVLIGTAWLVFWAIGASARISDFLISTEGEMKKVNWPARREVTGSTWVVVWCVVLLAALLYLCDLVFVYVLTGIGILES